MRFNYVRLPRMQPRRICNRRHVIIVRLNVNGLVLFRGCLCRNASLAGNLRRVSHYENLTLRLQNTCFLLNGVTGRFCFWHKLRVLFVTRLISRCLHLARMYSGFWHAKAVAAVISITPHLLRFYVASNYVYLWMELSKLRAFQMQFQRRVHCDSNSTAWKWNIIFLINKQNYTLEMNWRNALKRRIWYEIENWIGLLIGCCISWQFANSSTNSTVTKSCISLIRNIHFFATIISEWKIYWMK